MPDRLHGEADEQEARGTDDQRLVAPVEPPHHRESDDPDEDRVGDEEAEEGHHEDHRQVRERQRVGLAREQGGESGERHRVALGVGEAKGEPAPERAGHRHEGLLAVAPPRGQGGPAEPAEIEPADESEQIEHRRADGARADDGGQREARPHHVAGEMAADEQRPGPPPLPRPDPEQREERRPGGENVHGCGGEGAEKEGEGQRNIPNWFSTSENRS